MQAQKFMCLQIETVLIYLLHSVNFTWSVIWLLKILCEVTAQIQSQRKQTKFLFTVIQFILPIRDFMCYL